MTHWMMFYADRCFLASVKKVLDAPILEDYPDGEKVLQVDERRMSNCAIGVIACQAALEAITNSYFLIGLPEHKKYDALSIRKKLETAAQLSGESLVWNLPPWADVDKLIAIRNRLVHYHDPTVALVGSEGWASSPYPEFIPQQELTYKWLERYYQAVRQAGLKVAEWRGIEGYNIEFLKTEDYKIIMYE
jgi:hypothetical protein